MWDHHTKLTSLLVMLDTYDLPVTGEVGQCYHLFPKVTETLHKLGKVLGNFYLLKTFFHLELERSKILMR